MEMAQAYSWPALSLGSVEDLASVREEARAQGYEDGYSAGHEAALAEAEQLRQTLNESIAALAALDRSLPGSDATALLEMVRSVTRALLHVELSVNPEVVSKLIEEALGALNVERQALTLKVASADLDWLEVDGVEVLVEADRRPGCLCVETPAATVDFDPAQRLDELLRTADANCRA